MKLGTLSVACMCEEKVTNKVRKGKLFQIALLNLSYTVVGLTMTQPASLALLKSKKNTPYYYISSALNVSSIGLLQIMMIWSLSHFEWPKLCFHLPFIIITHVVICTLAHPLLNLGT